MNVCHKFDTLWFLERESRRPHRQPSLGDLPQYPLCALRVEGSTSVRAVGPAKANIDEDWKHVMTESGGQTRLAALTIFHTELAF